MSNRPLRKQMIDPTDDAPPPKDGIDASAPPERVERGAARRLRQELFEAAYWGQPPEKRKRFLELAKLAM